MATSSKQYKAIGEDLWKGRTEKIVRCHHIVLLPVTADNLSLTHPDIDIMIRMQSSSR